MLTRKKGLRRRHRAIGAPTEADIAYRERARALGCVACLLRVEQGLQHKGWFCGPTEFHHRNTGDLHGQKQMGHRDGIALGAYHHRGAPLWNFNGGAMVGAFGPSLALHKRAFVEWLQDTTGERSTAALQRYQDALLA